jgi:hypothetical protein
MPVTCALPPSPLTARCRGGGGSRSVFSPVLFALNGIGGPAGFACSRASASSVPCTALSADSTNVLGRGAPSPRLSGVI